MNTYFKEFTTGGIFRHRRVQGALMLLVALTLFLPQLRAAESQKITVYGASGSMGTRIVDEALSRGHTVTGVSRRVERLEGQHEGLRIVEGNVLDSGSIRDIVAGQDAVIVAINDDRNITDPDKHAVNLAAIAMVEAVRELGKDAPRVIQVLGAATLEVKPGVLMIDTMELEPGSGPYVLINGHKRAWDLYQRSPDVKWTIATPSRYIEAGERTAKFRVGGVEAMRNSEGELTNISIEDFAVAIIDEIEQEKYINQQLTAGY